MDGRERWTGIRYSKGQSQRHLDHLGRAGVIHIIIGGIILLYEVIAARWYYIRLLAIVLRRYKLKF